MVHRKETAHLQELDEVSIDVFVFAMIYLYS
jgi:hypothetical protein